MEVLRILFIGPSELYSRSSARSMTALTAGSLSAVRPAFVVFALSKTQALAVFFPQKGPSRCHGRRLYRHRRRRRPGAVLLEVVDLGIRLSADCDSGCGMVSSPVNVSRSERLINRSSPTKWKRASQVLGRGAWQGQGEFDSPVALR